MSDRQTPVNEDTASAPKRNRTKNETVEDSFADQEGKGYNHMKDKHLLPRKDTHKHTINRKIIV